MADVLADLYVILRAESGQLVAGFTEAGVSGEQMAAKIAAVSVDVEAEIARMDASLVSIGQAADDAAIQNAAAMDKMRADTVAAITGMEAAEAKAAASTEAMAAKIDAAAASSTATTAGKLQALKTAGVAVGVAAALVAAGSVKMAADFEQSTTRLVTSGGEIQANLDSDRQAILGMAGQVGYSAMELSDALYKVNGASFHGADGLNVLKASAQGAKAENANLTTVADAVSTALLDYHAKASDAADITSKMVAATSSGKMTFEEMAGSLNSILPAASAAGVSFNDVMGDLAAMTVHGMSADQAAQNLADAIRKMQTAATSTTQSKALAVLGLDANDVSQKLGERGLSGTLQMISDRVKNFMPPGSDKVILDLGTALNGTSQKVQDLADKLMNGEISQKQFAASAKGLTPIEYDQAEKFAGLVSQYHQLGTQQLSGQAVLQTYSGMMRQATGDATSLKVALMLAGDNAGVANSAIANVSKATADAGGNVQGWTEIQQTFNQRLAEAKDGLGALAISIGEKLLPVVSAIAGALATAAQWMSQHKQVADVLAIAVGIGLVIAFSALLAVMWGFVANPVTWIIAGIIVAIGLLAFAVYEIVSHWSSIVDWFAGIWHGIEDIFHTVIDAVVGFVKDWYPLILGVLSGGILLIPALIFKYWDQITAFVATVWNAVVGFLAGIWSGIVSGVVGAWNAVVGAITTAVDAVAGFITRGFTAIVNATRPIWQPIVTIISNVFQIIWTIVSTVVTIIGLFILAGWRAIVSVTTTVWNAVSGPIAAAWNFIAGIVMGAVNAISAGLTAAWNFIWGIISGVWNAIVGFLAQVWAGIVGEATAAWNLVSNAVSGPINVIWGIISSVWNNVVGFLGGVWNNIVSTVSNGIGDVLHWISGLAGKIWDTISGIGHWLWDAGVNLIEGLLNGIASMTGQLLDKVKQMASDAVNTVKSWLGISSPSKVFAAEVGVHIPTGIAAGIDAAAASAMTSARKLAQGVVNASQDVLGGGLTVPVVGGDLQMSGAGLAARGIATGIPGGSVSAPTLINLNVYVAGNVATEDDLIKAIQQGLLRFGIRNLGAGVTYAGFGK